jgi:excisionase family DNA binding protein
MSDMAGVPKLIFSVKEAAHSLAFCEATVRQYIKLGMLRATRTGRTIRIHYKDLESFSNYIREYGPPSIWAKDKPWRKEREARA